MPIYYPPPRPYFGLRKHAENGPYPEPPHAHPSRRPKYIYNIMELWRPPPPTPIQYRKVPLESTWEVTTNFPHTRIENGFHFRKSSPVESHILVQAIEISSLFSSGVRMPTLWQLVHGAISGATARIAHMDLDSGDWSLGSAAGTLVLSEVEGTWVDGEWVLNSSDAPMALLDMPNGLTHYSHVFKSNSAYLPPAPDLYTKFSSHESITYGETVIPTVYFTNAPDGCMVMMDGVKNWIWGGNEYRVAKFINFDPSASFWYDYTECVWNTEDDAKNKAVLHRVAGGTDAYCMTLLHCENDATDAMELHDWTATNVTYSTTYYKFGTYGAVLNGSDAHLSIADHADFDLSGGSFTIEGFFNFSAILGNTYLYYQHTTAADDSFQIYVDTSGAVHVKVVAATVAVVDIETDGGAISSTGVWYHIAVVEDDDTWYIFVNGEQRYKGTDTDRAANYTGAIYIGHNADTLYAAMRVDEVRISVGAARYIVPFTPPIVAFGSSYSTYAYLGSTRPIQGIYLYVKDANASAATAAVSYWNGTNWVLCASLTDTTSASGVALAQDGKLEFTSTVDLAKASMIKGSMAYYYQIVWSGLDDDASVYYATVDAAPQALVDIWDGSPRQIMQFFKCTSAGNYTDYTTNVFTQDYVDDDLPTFAKLDSLSYTSMVYVGFSERMCGVRLLLPDDGYINNTDNCIVSVYYWNGSAWTSVGAVQDDTTSPDGESLHHSGDITWQPKDQNTEFQTTINSTGPFYFYKLQWSKTLDGSVRVDYVTGIPAQQEVVPYRLAAMWQNRLWLLNEASHHKNGGVCSAYGTNCFFNGKDSAKVTFGGDEEIVGATTFFTRYGGNLYDNLVVFKRASIYLVDGTDMASWKQYCVSDTVGLIAPKTLVKCDVNFEVAPGVTKHVLMFRSARGIEYYDGNTITTVSKDIDAFFREGSEVEVNKNLVWREYGFFDAVRGEYHWGFASKNSTYLDQEWAYNVLEKKWYEVRRGDGRYLNCGWPVMDAQGNNYTFAGTCCARIMRTDFGTNFYGHPIEHILRTGDSPIDGLIEYITAIDQVKVMVKAKNASTNGDVTLEHYPDVDLEGTDITTFSMAHETKRVVQHKMGCSMSGALHSFELRVTTKDEPAGFEPISISGLYRVLREDK